MRWAVVCCFPHPTTRDARDLLFTAHAPSAAHSSHYTLVLTDLYSMAGWGRAGAVCRKYTQEAVVFSGENFHGDCFCTNLSIFSANIDDKFYNEHVDPY